MKLKLTRRQPETHDVESFFWQPETKLDYTSGQYLEWSLPHDHPDDRGDHRWFTISSSPTDGLISLTTKFNSQRSSSFKSALKALPTGSSLEVDGPYGDFVLDDGNQPVVLVAGGIGITPYHSMLTYLDAKQTMRPVHLIYACRTPDDVAFRDWLFVLQSKYPQQLKVTYYFETPGEFARQFETGRLNGQLIKQQANDGQKIYLSGPEPMAKAFKQELLDLGQPQNLIELDDFPGYD